MKERRKDLFWLIPMLLAIAIVVQHGWLQKYRSTSEVLIVHLDNTSIMTCDQDGALTTGSLKDAVVKDENGQKISYTELEIGDVVLLTSDDYVLLTYPMQYPNIYKVEKTGENAKWLAEHHYEEYKKDFTF